MSFKKTDLAYYSIAFCPLWGLIGRSPFKGVAQVWMGTQDKLPNPINCVRKSLPSKLQKWKKQDTYDEWTIHWESKTKNIIENETDDSLSRNKIDLSIRIVVSTQALKNQ